MNAHSSDPEHRPIPDPLDELRRWVVPRPPKPVPDASPGESSCESRAALDAPASPTALKLSREAEAFLRQVGSAYGTPVPLQTHWAAIGVRAGSIKSRVLDELRGAGLIHLEHRGKARTVHIHATGWEYLGLPPPKLHGRGGDLHRQLAELLAHHFKDQGYDVQIEKEVGPEKKRVDLIAFREDHRIGVEIALSDIEQELHNLTVDLRSGVLDLVIVVSPKSSMLHTIRRRARSDLWLATRLGRVKFQVLSTNEEENS